MDTIPHSAQEDNSQKYAIYALVDPRDYAVRYVGISRDVYQRFIQHIKCDGDNELKNAWIRELQQLNQMVKEWPKGE